jgi:hypothetical protein
MSILLGYSWIIFWEKKEGYRPGCTWWGDHTAAGQRTLRAYKKFPGGNAPCCPNCKQLLHLSGHDHAQSWMESALQYEIDGNSGFHHFMLWLNEKCFPDVMAARDAYEQDTGGKVHLGEVTS